MKMIKVNSDPGVGQKFQGYPEEILLRLQQLRRLILEAANEDEHIDQIDETLKWDEPSYLTKNGSTIRIDWKPKTPDQYAIYFKCTSKLVPTFRKVFGNLFRYENNRAIIFKMNDDIPESELKACIRAALNYHSVKGLQDLGINISG